MPGRSHRSKDYLIAQVAAQQHNLIGRWQLLELGVCDREINRRLGDGRLISVHPGVYSVGPVRVTEQRTRMAATLWGGPVAMLSHLTAGHHLDIWRGPPQSAVDVLLPYCRSNNDDVTWHYTRRLPPKFVWNDVPTTPPARTIVDLADVLTPHQVANTIHKARWTHRLDPANLHDELSKLSRRRSAPVARHAIDLHLSGSAGTRSMAEDTFLEIMQAVAPEPRVNMVHRLDLSTFEGDFVWATQRVWVEIDNPTSHGRPYDTSRDADLADRCAELGIMLIRFKSSHVRQRPSWVRRTVLAALHRG
jgi:hypothetical protein